MSATDITTENTAPTSPAMRLTRHMVGMALFSFLNPWWALGPDVAVSQTTGNVVVVFIFSALVSGLMRLFFTKGTGKDWAGNFIKTAWVFAGLLLIGQWSN